MHTNTLNRTFIRPIIQHYLKYDKENPFIFISAMLAFLGIAAGVMVLMIAMGIMNGTQQEFSKKLFVMNYPLTVLPIEENAVNIELLKALSKKFKVRGFPTVFILNPDGKTINKTGYQAGGPEAYVEYIKKAIAADKEKADKEKVVKAKAAKATDK
jgi:ABC-type lipoprotein release transport system permease subunit